MCTGEHVVRVVPKKLIFIFTVVRGVPGTLCKLICTVGRNLENYV